MNLILKIGDSSDNGQITIIDEDRLCYLVKSTSRGAEGIRTISKSLLAEFIDYFSKNPNASANEARDALSGQSKVDKFEYGYNSTLKVMAQMALGQIATTTKSFDSTSYKVQGIPLQQIYYGAPGTGKSHTIKDLTNGKNVIRTTFHPDSDYSTFVGAYKPTTKEVAMRDVTGHVIKENGQIVYENRIEYEFRAQAFCKPMSMLGNLLPELLTKILRLSI